MLVAVRFRPTLVADPERFSKLEVLPRLMMLFQVPGCDAAAPNELLGATKTLPKSMLKDCPFAGIGAAAATVRRRTAKQDARIVGAPWVKTAGKPQARICVA